MLQIKLGKDAALICGAYSKLFILSCTMPPKQQRGEERRARQRRKRKQVPPQTKAARAQSPVHSRAYTTHDTAWCLRYIKKYKSTLKDLVSAASLRCSGAPDAGIMKLGERGRLLLGRCQGFPLTEIAPGVADCCGDVSRHENS